MMGRSLERQSMDGPSDGKWTSCLFTKAASMIAEQTLRKGTSLVKVYPCRTRGSACISVEVEVHGVGICRGSSSAVVGGVDACSRV